VPEDLSNASGEELDHERYETDLYRSFIDEDEPCFENRMAFLRALQERHPERWVVFAARWPKQVAEDMKTAS